MGLMEGVDLDGITGNPRYVPDGKYPGFVFDAKRQQKKDGSSSVIFTYKIAEGVTTTIQTPKGPEVMDLSGKTVDEWKYATPAPNEPVDRNQLEYTTARWISLGVPLERVKEATKEDVVGKSVVITVKNSGQFTNVTNVELTAPTPGTDPFAGLVSSATADQKPY